MIHRLIAVFSFYSILASAEPIRVVISGGPGVGKSSIIGELEVRGERVIRETAADFIALQQSKGISKPWESKNFQRNINFIQQRREESIDSKIEVVFHDRSLIDSFGYYKYRKQDISAEVLSQLDELKLKSRYFPFVFFIKHLHQRVSALRFDMDESINIDIALREAYQELGYKIVDIDPDTVENRVKQILDFLKERGIWASTVGKAIPLLSH